MIREKELKRDYHDLIQNICRRLDNMGFDVISHEVKYDELKILHNAYVNLKYSEDKTLRAIWNRSFTNESLRGALEHIDQAELVYEESKAA